LTVQPCVEGRSCNFTEPGKNSGPASKRCMRVHLWLSCVPPSKLCFVVFQHRSFRPFSPRRGSVHSVLHRILHHHKKKYRLIISNPGRTATPACSINSSLAFGCQVDCLLVVVGCFAAVAQSIRTMTDYGAELLRRQLNGEDSVSMLAVWWRGAE
jgi:hypothetical protein